MDTGRPEGDLEAEWLALGGAADALAAAPGDEVLGEILALQFELAQQARLLFRNDTTMSLSHRLSYISKRHVAASKKVTIFWGVLY